MTRNVCVIRENFTYDVGTHKVPFNEKLDPL